VPEHVIWLSLAIFVVALLYSSVGHAGASGYIAVMSLFSLAPEVIRPTALVLNLLVASIGTYQFWRAGFLDCQLFWPFAIAAAPFAMFGGYAKLPTHYFKILVGFVLLFSAIRFLIRPSSDEVASKPSTPAAMGIGVGLGLLSGLTGTGGGIFLTPILLLKRWAQAKTAAAISAAFILVNSLAGLLGLVFRNSSSPELKLSFSLAATTGAAAIVGGAIGSYAGSRRLDHTMIKRLLAIVLLIAGLKFLLTK
jgi:uncharacterized membrane protein YfcA